MLICMRTTLNLPDALVAEAKALAAAEGVTFTSLLEDALRDRLQQQPDDVPVQSLPTYGTPGGRVFLVDIEDKDAVWGAFDDVS
ncbi:hypothetical protein CZ771_06350 [Actinomycetales bacterium JB111]|nr:hypothetical protein CZ771_06350 [Actinomycetales bacterium JB111]